MEGKQVSSTYPTAATFSLERVEDDSNGDLSWVAVESRQDPAASADFVLLILRIFVGTVFTFVWF